MLWLTHRPGIAANAEREEDESRVHRYLNRCRRARILRLCAAVVLGCALAAAAVVSPAGESARTDLPGTIRDALATQDVATDAVSILVRERGSGREHLRLNAEQGRNPASTIKLLTTYAALAELSPAYTWKTRVYAHGPIRDGTLDGDLWLIGDGDPYLTSEDFWYLLGAIRRRGVERITGDLVLDTSRFANIAGDSGAFDGHPLRAYNQPPHPLLVNFNAIEFELDEARDGDGVAVAMHPPLPRFELDNEVRLDPEAYCGAHRWHVDYTLKRSDERTAATLRGRYGAGCERASLYRTGLPVEDYVHGLFTSLWDHWGGEFDGGWRVGHWDDADAEPLVEHESRPLAEAVRASNKFSNNVMTRQLALTLAAEDEGSGVTEADGRSAVRSALRDQGLALAGVDLDDVAGLSRSNRVSAEFLARLLDSAADSIVMPEFLASLPISGRDGTLEERLAEGPVAGKARMKTGRIRDVGALAGYLRNAAGDDLTVVILLNGDGLQGQRGTAIQDAVVRWAYDQT